MGAFGLVKASGRAEDEDCDLGPSGCASLRIIVSDKKFPRVPPQMRSDIRVLRRERARWESANPPMAAREIDPSLDVSGREHCCGYEL